MISAFRQAIVSKNSLATALVNIAFASTINGGFVFNGKKETLTK
jgi:hypothetical protein